MNVVRTKFLARVLEQASGFCGESCAEHVDCASSLGRVVDEFSVGDGEIRRELGVPFEVAESALLANRTGNVF